jgi:hypothetical protein
MWSGRRRPRLCHFGAIADTLFGQLLDGIDLSQELQVRAMLP